MIDDPRLPQRFWDKVVPEPMTGCWLWTGRIDGGGYGEVDSMGRTRRAHRVAYEALVSRIPDGLELDHVRTRGCGVRCCVNPAHLEPVTGRVNTLRGNTAAARNAGKTHCPRGHAYNEVNTYHYGRRRMCRVCNRAAVDAYTARKARWGAGS